MNEECKEKMMQAFREFQEICSNLEQISDLIKSSNEISATSKSQVIPFLEGYSNGLKAVIEWLDIILEE